MTTLDEMRKALSVKRERSSPPVIDKESVGSDVISVDGIVLPTIKLQVKDDIFTASGIDPFLWTIYSKAQRDGVSARTTIRIKAETVADITIHASSKDKLTTEVQEVGAALVWSAIRAIAMKEKARVIGLINLTKVERFDKIDEWSRVRSSTRGEFARSYQIAQDHVRKIIEGGDDERASKGAK